MLLFDVGLGWVTSDYISRGLGWVCKVMGWVGLVYRKWTHGHVWSNVHIPEQVCCEWRYLLIFYCTDALFTIICKLL